MQSRNQEGVGVAAASADTDPILALAGARTAEQFCHAWLSMVCFLVPGVRVGLLLLQDTDNSYVPAAVWPGEADPAHLAAPAQEALNGRRGVVRRDPQTGTVLAYPLIVGTELMGVVILDWAFADDGLIAHTTRNLNWGEGWLANLLGQRTLTERNVQVERSAFLIDLTLGALAESDFRKSGLTIVNQLARRFDCPQVMLGSEKGKTVAVTALSQAAWFDERANLVNLAAQAMNEAFDQRVRIVQPAATEQPTLITTAHRRYMTEAGQSAVASQPLEQAGQIVGVLLLERNRPFTAAELEELEALAQALAPVLETRRGAQESLTAHAWRSWQALLRRLTDSSRPGLKLAALTVAVALLLAAVIPVVYRVAARAAIEGSVQRAAVAPFQSYIKDATVRAGDTVQQGQVLANLEDKELRLEQVRWQSEYEVATRKEREALAKADRVALRLAAAQASQAKAQLDLVNEKLARVHIAAPFDAVVVKGDLSQQLGSPVEQGKVLFELAPLDSWRVILKVDERDIADVALGKPGELVLTSLPGRSFPLTVTKITPVSVAEEGRNFFRVEAELTDQSLKVRPGMEGVAKIESDSQSLLWIWTHRLTDWLRLTLWQWSP